MKLYIAEKPSLAQVIAAGIGGVKKKEGFIEANDSIITWCFGHLYELAPPESYDEKFKQWSLETLPILPETIKRMAKKEAKKQIGIIKKLIKSSSSIVNAGDPDREGQLLVDIVIEEAGYKGKIERIWMEALDEKSVDKALTNLKPNSDYKGLKESAEARSIADWLYGINLTRAFTVKGKETGYKGVLSVGRVQTPTLALVVNRDRDIEGFKPVPFYSIRADFKNSDISFKGNWIVPEDKADSEGRCINKNFAAEVIEKIKGKTANVIERKEEIKKKEAELPFSLSKLQSYCSKKFGMGAKEVLDIAQSLYEKHKATTYPRTDCRYLSDGSFDEVNETIDAIFAADKELSKIEDLIDRTQKGKCFNSKKITAHTAIIPTRNKAGISAMSVKEKQVYEVVVKRYLSQFLPPYEYKAVSIITEAFDEKFSTKGKTEINKGWRILEAPLEDEKENKEEEDNSSNLDGIKKDAFVDCSEAQILDKKTTPPARFTEGSLIEGMGGIAKFVDDPEVKKRLKETAGLGTEATRAGIIETLKNRRYLEVQGKFLISAKIGREFIDIVPNMIKDPATTAQWEQVLESIENGVAQKAVFLKSQGKLVSSLVSKIKASTVKLTNPPEAPKKGKTKGKPRRTKKAA